MGNNCSGSGSASGSESESGTYTPQNEAMEYCDYMASRGPFWTHDCKAESSIKFAKEGCASWEPTTLIAMFRETATKHETMPAFMIERPCPELVDGHAPPALPIEEWKKWSWADYFGDVQTVAKAYVALGFAPFDSVSIWGFNSPEWIISAVAGVFAGGKMAGLYPTDSPETAAYKVVHSGASVLVLEDKGKLTKIVKGLNDRGDCKRLKAIVAWGFEPASGEKVMITGVGAVPVLSWASLLEKGNAFNDSGQLKMRQDAIKPGTCAALIYTSGTTGDPKATTILPMRPRW